MTIITSSPSIFVPLVGLVLTAITMASLFFYIKKKNMISIKILEIIVLTILEKIVDAEETGCGTIIIPDLRINMNKININNDTYNYKNYYALAYAVDRILLEEKTLIFPDPYLRIDINNDTYNNETYPVCKAVLKILVDEGLIKNFSKEINKDGNPVFKIKLYNRKVENNYKAWEKYKASFSFATVVTEVGPVRKCRSRDILKLTDEIINEKKRNNLFVNNLSVNNLFVLVLSGDMIMTGKQAQLQAQLNKKEQLVWVICYIIPAQIL